MANDIRNVHKVRQENDKGEVIYPETSADQVVTDDERRFVSDDDKSKLVMLPPSGGTKVEASTENGYIKTTDIIKDGDAYKTETKDLLVYKHENKAPIFNDEKASGAVINPHGISLFDITNGTMDLNSLNETLESKLNYSGGDMELIAKNIKDVVNRRTEELISGDKDTLYDIIDSEDGVVPWFQNGKTLNLILSVIRAHLKSARNPHVTTKAQIGLSKVTNTAPADMPISTKMENALNKRVYTDLFVLNANSYSAIPDGVTVNYILNTPEAYNQRGAIFNLSVNLKPTGNVKAFDPSAANMKSRGFPGVAIDSTPVNIATNSTLACASLMVLADSVIYVANVKEIRGTTNEFKNTVMYTTGMIKHTTDDGVVSRYVVQEEWRKISDSSDINPIFSRINNIESSISNIKNLINTKDSVDLFVPSYKNGIVSNISVLTDYFYPDSQMYTTLKADIDGDGVKEDSYDLFSKLKVEDANLSFRNLEYIDIYFSMDPDPIGQYLSGQNGGDYNQWERSGMIQDWYHRVYIGAIPKQMFVGGTDYGGGQTYVTKTFINMSHRHEFEYNGYHYTLHIPLKLSIDDESKTATIDLCYGSKASEVDGGAKITLYPSVSIRYFKETTRPLSDGSTGAAYVWEEAVNPSKVLTSTTLGDLLRSSLHITKIVGGVKAKSMTTLNDNSYLYPTKKDDAGIKYVLNTGITYSQELPAGTVVTVVLGSASSGISLVSCMYNGYRFNGYIESSKIDWEGLM